MIKNIVSILLFLSPLISASQNGDGRKIEPIKSLETKSNKSIQDGLIQTEISKMLEDQKLENKKTIRSIDEYTDIVHISTPSVIEIGTVFYVMPAYFYKTIDKDSVSFDIVFRVISENYTPSAKGLFVIFKDGTKYFDLEQKIAVKSPQKGREYTKENTTKISLTFDTDEPVTPKGYEYSTRLTLSKKDQINFLNKPILKFKLYNYEKVLDDDDAYFLSDLSKTLKSAK